MQISMEILSQLIPRADSGASVRQKALPLSPAESAFSKILDEKRTVMIYPILTESGPGKITREEDNVFKTSKKPEEDETLGAYLAIGVTGNQNMVVFILEGDKDSAAIPDINIETAVAPDEMIPVTSGTDASEEAPEPAAADTEPKPFIIDARDMATVRSESDDAPGPAARTVEAAKTNTVGDTEGLAGEVTAWTPSIRTSENKENGEDGPEYSNNGDLSPLENENDKTPVKGQKEKTYSEIANTVRGKAEGAKEPAGDAAVPLADGIKPERFQADQQMGQATVKAAVRKENLFDEMISRIEMMRSESRSEVAIQLKPEFLGKVALEIAMDATGLHLRINAEDSSVRSMINTQMAALIESLENKGIAVVEVEVTYTGVNNGAFKDSREDQAQPDRPRRTYREINSLETAEFYTALPLGALEYYLDEDVSSVEYRA